MTVSKEQWEQIEQKLGGIFCRVTLKCDGYDITAEVHQDKMRLVIAVYVNGFIDFKYVFNDADSEIPAKFWKEKKRFKYTKRMRDFYLKSSRLRCFSKEERAGYAAKVKEMKSSWWPYWTDAKSLCRHLRKTCTSIEVVKIGY